ncbi:spore germination protein [Cytobacillus sp. FJAT-53684]|uniref:Spore germination protein n=1 Tax=Cytobacillus mangrovibacter TaxID=3299024 RepID=A0ABW6K0S4_9BACI
MNRRESTISNYQAAVIIINFILAAGILSLPRTATEEVKTPDAWISVALGGIIAIIIGYFMVKLSQTFPNKTFFQYSRTLLGKWIGGFLSIILAFYFITLSSFEIRTLSEVVSFYLLEGTPNWATIMPFLWIGLYLSSGGIQAVGRMFEIILPITILFFIIVILMSFKIFEIKNLQPVMGHGIVPVLRGVKTTALSFIGVEIVLVILAFMKEPQKGVKVMALGVIIPLVFYLGIVTMVIGSLSVDGVVHKTWPSLALIRSYEMPGLFLERFESLLLVIWTMQIFSTFCITYFAASLGLSQVFNVNIRKFLFALLPIIYLGSIIPKNIEQVFSLGDFLGEVAIVLFVFLPLPLFLLSKWKGGSK